MLLAVIPSATDGRWGVLSSLWPSSSATPEPEPTSNPSSDLGAPEAQLIKDCIKQTKGEQLHDELFLRDLPAERLGDPVSGTLATSSEPYVLWLFDADCKSYEAAAVPPRSSVTFRAYVGQVWYYAEASAKQPVGACDCRVFSPSNSGVPQTISDTGRLTYRTE
ncbi:hypothetical protein C1I95_15495 [Micromonospora craterilacus]|uniref:Uncharacterized protein n=1 Tax=Micromonospora craterilacus TaxID=1655439 RepID=A0A2W2E0H8_9ACTN|nr:hypothetical protein C1I95_15495 [Micromonospora craterilacus]